MSHADLASSPRLAHLSAAEIAQYASHIAQQQHGSAFAPVQPSETPAGIHAAASLAVRACTQHALHSIAGSSYGDMWLSRANLLGTEVVVRVHY